ncbi:PREDICTED: uncharacterized protein LOC109230264 [Nicotiana attenuata]|uniref:uncharacterized protein LOC109230264 n=1 Tax=Nicotiana attenuata TaxID=49451 RepID=UPI0009055EAE|nr:PREDICTED: uncharacterized protein LOC109230264 [Nicotiana attenuata]
MTFKDIPEARKVINLYCLANCYGLKQLKSDSRRLRYKCDVGCPFFCLISEDKNGGGVKIKTLKSKHKCNPAYDNPRIDKNTIAEYFKNKLQENPMIKVKEMQMTLKNTFNINVSHAKCKRAKRMILESLAGSFTDEYNKIEAYANELRLSNPGSDVIVTLSKDALAGGKRRFSRMYICFHALKMGFKSGLRSFIGLDGTFLKGKAKGQLLVVVALDSMNHFYPISWAVVDKETKVTWTWFLTLLNNSLELKLGEGYTFMSDMQKRLIEAIQAVVPDAHHRYCVRHTEANWCNMGCWGFEEKVPVVVCMEAYFDTVCKNQQVDNNITEIFNSWILDARHKPIIRMLEDIRVKVMTMLRKHEGEVMTWTENELLKKHRVNINLKKCTCRTWDLTGIPCPHAIRALLYEKVNPLSEIHWWFTKEVYLSTYAHKLEPIRGEKFWNIEPAHVMEPSLLVNMAGRPKVNRTREKNETINRQGEWSQSRKGRVMTCSTCGKPGHNAKGSKQGKAATAGKKTKKRLRTLVDENDEDTMDRSPAVEGLSLEEELQLTAPQVSQASSNSGPHYMFMPTPSMSRKQSISNAEADFDYPEADNPDPPILPRRV